MTVSGSIYISVICTNLSLLWMNNIPLYICIHIYIYVSYLYSYIDGHLGCFHVLAIVYSAEMNTGVHVFFKLWFIPGLCPAVELLGHMVILFSFF